MKKSIVVVTVGVVLMITGLALSQMGDKDQGMMAKKTEMMEDRGSMMGSKGMMGMHDMMMKMSDMMHKTVIATSDGGFVIVGPDKITKYDKDLNVFKEVELKADTEGIKRMMGDMMEKCSK